MNILVVSEKITKGGLETHVRALYNELKDNNNFYFCCNKYSCEANYGFENVYDKFVFSCFSSINDFVNDVDGLVKIIVEKNIDIIHIHPFFSFFAAVIAANITNTPIVYTCHGRSSINFCKTINEQILYHYSIEKIISKVICVNSNHVDFFEKQRKNISCYLPNMIETSKYKKNDVQFNKRWALISRLDNDKIEEIKLFISYLPKLDIEKLDIYGDGESVEILKQYIDQLSLSKKVELKGFLKDVNESLNNQYTGVIGIGRVVLEALAMGYPTILIGFEKIAGLINKKLFDKVCAVNFVPDSVKNISLDELINQINYINENNKGHDFSGVIRRKYDSKVIAKKYYKLISDLEYNGYVIINNIYKRIKELNHDEFANELVFESKNVYYILKEYLSLDSINTTVNNMFICADEIYRVERIRSEINEND